MLSFVFAHLNLEEDVPSLWTQFSGLPEKAMAPHSSTLAWKIPWMEEPSGLQSMGSHRVGHDWGTSLSFFSFMYWRRKWQPTPVFLPGESQGRQKLVGCCLGSHRVIHDLAAAAAALGYNKVGGLSALFSTKPATDEKSAHAPHAWDRSPFCL